MGYPRFGALIALSLAKLFVGSATIDTLVQAALIAFAAEVRVKRKLVEIWSQTLVSPNNQTNSLAIHDFQKVPLPNHSVWGRTVYKFFLFCCANIQIVIFCRKTMISHDERYSFLIFFAPIAVPSNCKAVENLVSYVLWRAKVNLCPAARYATDQDNGHKQWAQHGMSPRMAPN